MDDEARTAGLTLFSVLCAFKLITAVLVFLMQPSIGAAIFLTIFNWYMLPPVIFFGGIGATMLGLRLLRARLRRRRLRQAEFVLEQPRSTSTPTQPPG